jgi:hypothetical protein
MKTQDFLNHVRLYKPLTWWICRFGFERGEYLHISGNGRLEPILHDLTESEDAMVMEWILAEVLVAFALGWIAGRGNGFEDGYRQCWKHLMEMKR